MIDFQGVRDDADTTPATRPRPPTALTADRLADHLTKYDLHITPAERMAMEATISALDQVPGREAAARRARPGTDHPTPRTDPE